MNKLIYLDNASSTPCDQRIIKGILLFFSKNYANPSNITNTLGIDANTAISLARNKVAKLFNCLPQNIIWTSGATESNNIALQGVFKKYKKLNQKSKYHIITSSIEHKSVLETLKSLQDVDISFIKPDSDGITHLKDIENCINENTFLISIMMANNELGVLNDIEVIGKICQKRNILFHSDATQAIGKLPIDLNKLNIDLLSFSGHKIYAPKGVGALYIKDPSIISPLYYGGGQEWGYRPGTLNVPGIVGLGIACEIFQSDQNTESLKIRNLRDIFESEIVKLNKNIIINRVKAQRVSNISNVSFPIKKGISIINNINLIACSSGSACDTLDHIPSHVLTEIGKSILEAKNTIRFSLGRFTKIEDIKNAIEYIKEILKIY